MKWPRQVFSPTDQLEIEMHTGVNNESSFRSWLMQLVNMLHKHDPSAKHPELDYKILGKEPQWKTDSLVKDIKKLQKEVRLKTAELYRREYGAYITEIKDFLTAYMNDAHNLGDTVEIEEMYDDTGVGEKLYHISGSRSRS